MTKEILVNVGRRETRVAMVEDGRLAELKLERERDVLGNIYRGTVENVVSGLDAAFVDCGLDRNVFLHVSDAVLEEPSKKMLRRKMDSFPPIAEVVHLGQDMLVQVTKGSVGSKGPRATRRISLPGRYLVLMVQGGGKVGVSRKIEDEAERDRLRDLGEKVRPEGMGIIIRTRAEGVGRTELQRDISFLTRLWASIQRRAKRTPPPAVIHEDLSLVFEILRDVFSADIDRFVVDDDEVYAKVRNLVATIAPDLRDRVVRYQGAKPLFTEYDLEKEIERALRPRVWLPQGGHINIDPTEALTAIDVNSGKFTGARNLTDTVLRTNLQAVEEIVRQVRVRDLGGIIVVDFIDMDNPNHRRDVMARLKEELKKDRVRTRVAHLTPLGLVEMTRKRTGDPLNVQLQSTCPCCEGRGRIASVETTAIRIEERLRELATKSGAAEFRVVCTPAVCLQFLGEDGAEIALLEEELGRRIHVRCNAGMHPERFVINGGAPAGLNEEGLPFVVGQMVTIEPAQMLEMPAEGLLAAVDGYLIRVPGGPGALDQALSVRLTEVGRSLARGTAGGDKAGGRRRGGEARPSAVRSAPELEDVEVAAEESTQEPGSEMPAAAPRKRRRSRGGRRRKSAGARTAVGQVPAAAPAAAEAVPEPTELSPLAEALLEEGLPEAEPREMPETPEASTATTAAPHKRRRSRGGRRRKTAAAPAPAGGETEVPAAEPSPEPSAGEAPGVPVPADAPSGEAAPEAATTPARRPRRRSTGARRKATPAAEAPGDATEVSPEPAEVAAPAEPPSPDAVAPTADTAPAPKSRWRTRPVRRKKSPEAPAADEPAE